MEASITSDPLVIARHARITRVCHWINALCVILLICSGFQIFNAHPELYWGQKGSRFGDAWLAVGSLHDSTGALRGVVKLGPFVFDTTGLFGASQLNGVTVARAYPAWLTLPSHKSLTEGRLWHFFLAWILVINGVVYWGAGLLNRHIRRDLLPRRTELSFRHIWHDIVEHAQLKFPTGEAAKAYNILQKLAYLAVIVLLVPVMVLTGLTMSPGVDAACPWLLDLFGGRQSARSVHWIACNLLVGFIAVHLLMVALAGAANEIGSMITGRYRIKPDPILEPAE